MLTITVNDDRSITATSDDSNAENVGVADALQAAGDHDLERIWNETAMDEENQLVVTIEAERAVRFLEALEEEGFEVDDALTELKADEYVPGKPKP